MQYYIEDNGQIYYIGVPKDGKVIGTLKDKNETKEFEISRIKHICAIRENNKEHIISIQQYLMETNSLETFNEWEANSIILQMILSIVPIICQVLFMYSGFSVNIWTPVLAILGFGFGFWGYKRTKSKTCFILCILNILAIIIAFIYGYKTNTIMW